MTLAVLVSIFALAFVQIFNATQVPIYYQKERETVSAATHVFETKDDDVHNTTEMKTTLRIKNNRPSIQLASATDTNHVILISQNETIDSIISSTNDTTTGHCKENFTYVADRYAPAFSSATTRSKIPNLLYQTGPSRCVFTELYEATIQKWNFIAEYRFVDDSAMDEYLYDTRWTSMFPAFSLALQCIEHVQMPVMKADLWRYLLLWEHGGIFADLDVIPTKAFDSFTLQPEFDAAFVLVHLAGKQIPSQWFLAASPHHPIMLYALQKAVARVLKAKRAIPIQHTGPKALNEGTALFLNHNKNAFYASLQAHHTYLGHGNRSFHVLPAGVAQNEAFLPIKDKSYKEMNMTHYKSLARMGKNYRGKTCLEFLGGKANGTSGFWHEKVYYDFNIATV